MMYRIVVSWEHDEVVDLSNSKFFIVQLIGIGNFIHNAFFFLFIIRDKAEEISKCEEDYFGRGFE